MNKLFITITLSIIVLTASARRGWHSKSDNGFTIGVGGAFNSTWLFNTNVSNMGSGVNYHTTFGGQFGVDWTYNFTEHLGLAGGVLYTMHNQQYDLGGTSAPTSLTFETHLKYIEIPLLFRVGSLNQGVYFEIGPQIGILTSATEDFATIPSDTSNYTGKDRKSDFKSFDFAGVIGVGGTFDLSDNLVMSAGLRMGWSFTDATVQYSETELAVLSASNAIGVTDLLAHTSYKTDPVTHQNLYEYNPTNRAFGGIFISVNYKLK